MAFCSSLSLSTTFLTPIGTPMDSPLGSESGSVTPVSLDSVGSPMLPGPAPLERMASSDHKLPDLFHDYEKCEGVSNHAHRVFLITTETGQDKTLDKLKRHEMNGDTMVGVSGFFTLNAAAVRKTESATPGKGVKYLILIDCSTRVNDFWMEMQAIIARSSKREEVIAEVNSLLLRKKDEYYAIGTSNPCQSSQIASFYIDGLDKEVQSGVSWLSSDEKFQKIKEIFDSGHFTFLQQNLCDKKAMDNLASIMKEKGMTLDTLYLSNIREYAEYDGLLGLYQDSLDKLITARAFVIDTRLREGGCRQEKERLIQRVFRRNTESLASCFPASPEVKTGRTDGSAFAALFQQKMRESNEKT